MRMRQPNLFFSRFLKIFAFLVMMMALLPLCSQKVSNNNLMLSLLNYTLGKSSNLCVSGFSREISSWPILGEFVDEQDVVTLWITGRIALACDNYTLARQSLYPLVERVENNPLLYQDVVMALGAQGDFQTLESIYQQFPPSTQAISDTIAFVYLTQTEDYETILRFHPNDLYATYHLWRQAMTASDLAQLEVYSDTLTYFPLWAISSRDPRLFEYTTHIIPQLFKEGMWSHDQLKSVVEFLVWQGDHPAPTIELLTQLMSTYPDEPDWSFLLAESYHRQEHLKLAQSYYSHTLFLDNAYAPAYLRLGMVYEMLAESDDLLRSSYLQLAQSYYEDYQRFAPNDLLGAEKLAAVCAQLNLLQPRKCNLNIHPDPRQIAGELLSMPVERISLSANLLPNDEPGGSHNRWHISNMANYAPFSRALYVISGDNWQTWEGSASGRVMGLWTAWQPGYSQPRAGFWAWDDVLNTPLTISATQGEQYLVLVTYSSTDTKASIWVSESVFDSVRGDIFLPATDREVRQFAEILSVQNTGEFNCLIRYWGGESALFYSVGIYRVQSLP